MEHHYRIWVCVEKLEEKACCLVDDLIKVPKQNAIAQILFSKPQNNS